MHNYVKTFCNTNQFPPLKFCGLHNKPHGVRGLSKRYLMWFDPKLGYGKCTIFHIPCACAECTYMLDKPWVNGFLTHQQPGYQSVTDCTN